MTDTTLQCPHCGSAIELTAALTAQMRAEVGEQLAAAHAQQLREAEVRARTIAEQSVNRLITEQGVQLTAQALRAQEAHADALKLRRRNLELEETQRTQAEQIRLELEGTLRRENEVRIQALVQAAAVRARQEHAAELQLARDQLADQRTRLDQAERAELKVRQHAAVLEERSRGLDLEVARRVDEQKSGLEQSIRTSVSQELSLQVREKDKQISDMCKIIEDLKRKSEQGSPDLHGEVLEIDVQATLEGLFPDDDIAPVPKGTAGADLIQTVRNDLGQDCGRIIWEAKNTRRWQAAWLEKLRDDQRRVGANLAVLVSVTLPPSIRTFEQIDGVWVASVTVFHAVAFALREQLIQVAFAQAAAHGKDEKMGLMYDYLAGSQFRQKVLGIIEAFGALRRQTERERCAMERIWKEREKQLERVIRNTVGMYGEMRGILGTALQSIPALELEDEGSLLAGPADSEINS